MKKQRNYDKKERNTRIHLADYLVLKRISQAAGVSMAEALHRLIEYQAQLPLPIPASVVLYPKSIESNGFASFKPKSITDNEDNQVRLKSIR